MLNITTMSTVPSVTGLLADEIEIFTDSDLKWLKHFTFFYMSVGGKSNAMNINCIP